ncbi:monosaccharide transporter [Moniliophthora roreri]|nr:monosaccharide transporter [Moniliophthora roreri]
MPSTIARRYSSPPLATPYSMEWSTGVTCRSTLSFVLFLFPVGHQAIVAVSKRSSTQNDSFKTEIKQRWLTVKDKRRVLGRLKIQDVGGWLKIQREKSDPTFPSPTLDVLFDLVDIIIRALVRQTCQVREEASGCYWFEDGTQDIMIGVFRYRDSWALPLWSCTGFQAPSMLRGHRISVGGVEFEKKTQFPNWVCGGVVVLRNPAL